MLNSWKAVREYMQRTRVCQRLLGLQSRRAALCAGYSYRLSQQYTSRKNLSSIPHWRSQAQTSEAGSIFFFLLVALPLLLAFSVFSIDLTRYYLLRTRAQATADSIALRAARFLPDHEKAQEILFREIASLKHLTIARNADGTPQVEINPEGIAFSLVGTITFSLFPSASFHVSESQLRTASPVFGIQESTRVQVVPSDVALIFSDSLSQAPLSYQSWGEDLEWPIAPPLVSLSLSCNGLSPCLSDVNSYKKWLTQRCFNPQYSVVKQAVIELHRWFSNGEQNTVSVLATPGSSQNRGYDRLDKDLSLARWIDETGRYADDICVVLSDRSLLHDNPYSFPYGATSVEHNCSSLAVRNSGSYLPLQMVSECALKSRTVAETIWTHPVHAEELGAEELQQALTQAVSTVERTAVSLQGRGRLASRSNKVVIALLESLPSLSAAFIEQIRESPATIEVIIFRDAEIFGADAEHELIERRLEVLRAFGLTNFSLRYVRTSEELQQLLGEVLTRTHPEVLIKS